MEKKQIIPPGTKWGSLTYISDIECIEKKKRPLLVKCDCGIEKKVDLSALRQNPVFITCGSSVCRRRMQDNLSAKLILADEVREEFKSSVRTSLDELTEYWREIESTGKVHNISNGMLMTRQFLVN